MILNSGFIELTINGVSFYCPWKDYDKWIVGNTRKYVLEYVTEYQDIIDVSKNIYSIICGHTTAVGNPQVILGTSEFIYKYFLMRHHACRLLQKMIKEVTTNDGNMLRVYSDLLYEVEVELLSININSKVNV